VDLEGTDIGDSLHISAVKLPAGVKPVIADRDFTIATIAGSSAMKPEVTEEAEAAPAPAVEEEAEEEKK
jgi:large subunit ribosomal protein L25